MSEYIYSIEASFFYQHYPQFLTSTDVWITDEDLMAIPTKQYVCVLHLQDMNVPSRTFCKHLGFLSKWYTTHVVDADVVSFPAMIMSHTCDEYNKRHHVSLSGMLLSEVASAQGEMNFGCDLNLYVRFPKHDVEKSKKRASSCSKRVWGGLIHCWLIESHRRHAYVRKRKRVDTHETLLWSHTTGSCNKNHQMECAITNVHFIKGR